MIGENRTSSSQKLVHLDFLRGMAALAVCACHLRAFQFLEFSKIAAPTLVQKLFYFMTGLGHQSVMIFFVLSGFFIAGSIHENADAGRWSWRGYSIKRLARLWVVLVPALVLTGVWDTIGSKATGGAGYDGAYLSLINSGPQPDQPAQNGLSTFLGNLFFLQTIVCPPYGTNGPLWSLANEFWYYTLFPLAFISLYPGRARVERITCAAAALALFVLLPGSLLEGGLVWLMGYGVHLVLRGAAIKRTVANAPFFVMSGCAFLVSLWLSRVQPTRYGGLLIGITFAGILPFLIVNRRASGWYHTISTRLSEMSYTLYLVHFPLLAFLFFSLRLPQKSFPSLANLFVFALLLALLLGYALLVWFLFERRTAEARRQLERVFSALRRPAFGSPVWTFGTQSKSSPPPPIHCATPPTTGGNAATAPAPAKTESSNPHSII